MKRIAIALCMTLALAGVLAAQHLRKAPLSFVGNPVYSLTVTPLDWKFESMTGVSTQKIEQQVSNRLMQTLGWAQRIKKPNDRESKVPEGSVQVTLNITERTRQQVAYNFRVTVDTPVNWPARFRGNQDLAAWHWDGGDSGVSKLGDYPREIRKDMDKVLQDLVKAWGDRFK